MVDRRESKTSNSEVENVQGSEGDDCESYKESEYESERLESSGESDGYKEANTLFRGKDVSKK